MRRPLPAGAVVTDVPAPASASDQVAAEAAPPEAAAPAPPERKPLPPDAVITEPPSRWRAGVSTTAQGMSFGFEDELQGAGGALGELVYNLASNGRLPTGKELRDAYTTSRDDERKSVADAQKFYPKQSLVTELAGGLLTPVPGLGGAEAVATAARTVGLGVRAVKAAKILAPAAGYGAAAAIGGQDSGEGNLASAGELASAGASGALEGAAVAGAVHGGVKVAKVVGRKALAALPGGGREQIKAAIVDEISRNPEGKQVRDTVKKHLARAADAIYDEMVTGPDSKVVQQAFHAPVAKDGIALLQPVIDKLGQERDAAYGVFENAGAHIVDLPTEYAPRLTKLEQKFRDSGDKNMADGLAGIREMILDEGTKVTGGKTDLQWLRAHTTSFQQAAASKIGGLEEHETAKLAKQVSQQAKDVLDDVLIGKAEGLSKQGELPYPQVHLRQAMDRMHEATGNPAFKQASLRLSESPSAGQLDLGKAAPRATSADLKRAAKDLKRINRRFYGLLTGQTALEERAVKEAVSGGSVERAVKKIGGSVASLGSGGIGAVVGGAVAGPIGAGVGAALGSQAPRMARAIDRKLTARAINRLRAAATDRGGDPAGTIRSLSTELGVPERSLRAAYVRLLLGQSEAREDVPVAR